MRAIVNTARGSARETLELRELATPDVGPGQVLVRVMASGVNPSDAKVRSGAQGEMVAPVVIPHNDGAGFIEQVGEGVSAHRVGQLVWLYNVNRSADGMAQGEVGTAADYVVVDAALAPPLPQGTNFEEGACLGVPAMTAHRALSVAGDLAGKRVLVSGGAGSVGLLAVQLAVYGGAEVIATVSSEAKAAIARGAGAHHLINYREQNVAEVIVETFGENAIDHIVDVDFASHIGEVPRILCRNGSIGAYASASNTEPMLPYYPVMFNNTRVQFVFVYAMPESAKREAIETINQALVVGALSPHVAGTFSLADTAAAHEQVESGSLLGNAVIVLGQ